MRMGLLACPGLHTVPGRPADEFYCSIPGNALDALYPQHPGIPVSMLRDAVLGVVNNTIDPADIPPPAPYGQEAVERWGAFIVKLDWQQYPDQHYNHRELLT